MSFKGKVILITGASSGIGAATAKHFAILGAKLALIGRNLKNLQNTLSEHTETDSVLLTGDLTNELETKFVFKEVIKHFKKLDILINNAGIIENGSIENTSVEQYDRVMNINVKSVYHLTMMAVPHLIKTKGNIVNVSSISGLRSSPGILAYCLSKSAIDQFTRCLALELAAKQVRVNGVNPGVTVTNLFLRGGMDTEQFSAFLNRSKETHPLGRPGNPQEVASAIAYLASDHASNVTGVNLSVDGGRQVFCPR